MTITIPVLRAARAAGNAAKDGAEGWADVATIAAGVHATLHDDVGGDLASTVSWSGEGQPEAYTALSTNALSVDTVRVMMTDVAGAVYAFGGCLLQAAGWWEDVQTHLDPAVFAVADDGTVTVHPGAKPPPGAPTPQQLTAQLQEILGYLVVADQNLAGALNRALASPLPVSSTSGDAGFVKQVHDLWDQVYDPNQPPDNWDEKWTPMGHTFGESDYEWRRALGTLGDCSALRPYKGGGYMIGPDGRKYEIATPQMVVDGKIYGHGYGADSVGGTDVGWQTVGVSQGFAQLGEPAPGMSKAFVFLGALAGGDMKPVISADPRATASLVLDDKGFPVATRDKLPDPMSKPPDGKSPERTVVHTDAQGHSTVTTYSEPSIGGERMEAGMTVATNGLEGLNSVKHMDDGTYYTYRAEFQQNVDGRTRVVYTTYQVENTPDGSQTVTPYDTSMGQDGKLHMEKATWYDGPHRDRYDYEHQLHVAGN